MHAIVDLRPFFDNFETKKLRKTAINMKKKTSFHALPVYLYLSICLSTSFPGPDPHWSGSSMVTYMYLLSIIFIFSAKMKVSFAAAKSNIDKKSKPYKFFSIFSAYQNNNKFEEKNLLKYKLFWWPPNKWHLFLEPASGSGSGIQIRIGIRIPKHRRIRICKRNVCGSETLLFYT